MMIRIDMSDEYVGNKNSVKNKSHAFGQDRKGNFSGSFVFLAKFVFLQM